MVTQFRTVRQDAGHLHGGSTRQKLSMIATVTNQGKTRWMIIDEAFKAKLKLAATEHRVKLEQSPELVKRFFQDPRDKYAA